MTKTFEEVLNKIMFNGVAPITNEKFYLKSLLISFFRNWHSDEEFTKLRDDLDCASERVELLEGTVDDLKSQLQQQALPVVPECVAKLPPFDDMKEYVFDERLLIIREFLNKLDDKSNNEITEAEAWCMIHEDIAYRAMLDGYTVEKLQLFYLKNKITGDLLFRKNSGYKDDYCEIPESNLLNKKSAQFTQAEIDSMKTGSYEQIKAAE